MKKRQGNCPACAALINFKTSTSLVAVCEYCHSIIARTDKALEDHGKVADLAETNSPLHLEQRGSFRGKSFHIIGHTQYRHSAGGIWDEWYLYLSNGKWGWLAEANGHFYLTFPRTGHTLGELSEWEVGKKLTIPEVGELTAHEVGTAQFLSAAGELPFSISPGTSHPFVDLSGPKGLYGTISQKPEAEQSEGRVELFLGREVTLEELKIKRPPMPKEETGPSLSATQVGTLQVSCPQCGGPLELRAPDQSLRVACPNCGALSECNQGSLKYLTTLILPQARPLIPLGSKGRLLDIELTVIGFVRRSVTFDLKYYWNEYLLYSPRLGFRWLVHSDGHWSFVESIRFGEIDLKETDLRYEGRKFRLYQRADLTVEYVLGEFYWKVEAGETVSGSDFVRPPEMISLEYTNNEQGAQEVTASRGIYLKQNQVAEAFQVDLSATNQEGIAPNQPFPHRKIYRLWLLTAAATFLLGLAMIWTARPREVIKFTASGALNGLPGELTLIETPFELRGKHLNVQVHAPVSNNWVFVGGEFYNQETGLVQAFSVPVEYYYGTEGGENWSEGSQSTQIGLSALPAGKYTMRLEVQSGELSNRPGVIVTVTEGDAQYLPWILTLVLISLVPLMTFFYHWNFDYRRWQNSDYSPYSQSSGDDD